MEKKHLPEKIDGERLYLKKHSLDLAEKMFKYVDEDRERLSKFLPWPKHVTTVQHEIDFINLSLEQWDRHTGYGYGIFRKSDDLYMGNIGIHAISWGWDRCEIGYWILGRFEGQGYMIEATKTLCNALYEHGFNRVEIHCDPNNNRSGNIPRALGFKCEARMADLVKDGEGNYRTMHVFARLKSQGVVALVPQKSLPILKTANLTLRLPTPEDIPAIISYFRENEVHLSPFDPKKPEDFYTEKFWRQRVPQHTEDFFADRSLRLYLFHRESLEVVGSMEFSQISRGPFQACYLGYGIAAKFQGKGLMFEALTEAIRYAFDELNIHRVMANHLPENTRSASVLQRLGFARECVAKDYLQINGKWRDHVLNSLTNANWRAS
jgi:[ribosomal protein S5]-alanine N-acetyltransferase